MFEVTSCFCEYNGEILLLLRADTKPQGNTWGVPAGKIGDKETLLDATKREIKEETGITITGQALQYINKMYVKYPKFAFTYCMFRAKFTQMPKVTINNVEHKDFIWVSPKKALELNLIEDLDECIKMVYL